MFNIVGLEELVFGVEDIKGCTQYLVDYGLTPVVLSEVGGRFEAADGTAVIIWRSDHPMLPEPMTGHPSIRESVYGVDNLATLDAIAAEVGKDRDVRRGADGSVHFRDEEGFALGFKVTRRRAIASAVRAAPLDQAGVLQGMAVVPQTLSHVVYFVRDYARQERFYQERLGFITTDTFTGVGPFMRAAGSADHHQVFFIQTPPFLNGVEHFTFHFQSGTHVMLAGTHFANKGYQSFWGPGRHIFGSNWFWYFNSPFGCKVEFDAEMDQHDDNWVARHAPMTADNAQLFLFSQAEKFVPGGPPPGGAKATHV
ncbi:glyoxalase/Bleomycin resistance protein/Dioxygenase superfamily protein [Asticcacaulis biprosthecium C19]|uniref:Glyoxalase/Bleomycin resistance protein/Dioxygenase superfamily protein n=1 Tax=Asticcacaulis biprosthecium C19 TaxID=715226 RepID=F4QT98_9CAUL|nr:VOC family protein [Asticcacaulis biprosthecium]EGF89968.1 glyoxalase/Bleomycin resistance protein/Dioxygenase superfamily protein [Asticcacaulis biprosthecium C19]